jgi:hypothetical protein
VRIELASVKAKDVAERWKAQYWYPNGWKDTASGSSEKVYDKLLTAPDDPEVLAKIIGNESWTHIRCHGCNETGKAAVCLELTAKNYGCARHVSRLDPQPSTRFFRP